MIYWTLGIFFLNINELLRLNVTFYDAIYIINDVINFHTMLNFLFVGVRNSKNQHIRLGKINEIRSLHSVVIRAISKISNEVVRIDNCLAKARQLSNLPTSLKIFVIYATLCTYCLFTNSLL